jgi:hypothetical protein
LSYATLTVSIARKWVVGKNSGGTSGRKARQSQEICRSEPA